MTPQQPTRPSHTRWVPVIAALAASALLLSSCGGDSSHGGGTSGSASGSGDNVQRSAGDHSVDIADVYDANPQDRENLQQGGQLTLPSGGVGPNFNVATMDGYFGSILDIMLPMNNGGFWNADAEGNAVVNEDYLLDFEEEITEDGTQILHYELNPDAVWNDGTPIDFYTYEHTVNVNQDPDFDAVAHGTYNRVGSMEMGEDEWSFSVTMDEMLQPYSSLFRAYSIVHPEVDTPEEFTEGFIHDPRPEYRAGPYILDIYDAAARVVSMVPNEDWWGDEPLLDRVNFVHYEAAASLQAFQNGEIDVVDATTLERYSELESWRPEGDEYEFRRGYHMGDNGLLFNAHATNLGDVEVRKAIFQGIDRQQMADVRFQGLGWSETPPGSWLLMPFHEKYEDNYPVPEEERANPEVAGETLDAAGWTLEDGAEFRTNEDGDRLTIQLDVFGDDSTNAAYAQTFQTQMQAIGIDLQMSTRQAGEFVDAMNSGDFSLVMSGYGKGSDPITTAPMWFWGSGDDVNNPTGLGNEELDERMAALPTIVDLDERIAESLDIERVAIGEYFHFLNVYNGPSIQAIRTGLANYGPRLTETVDWTIVGWEADSDHDGTDTGVDADELDEDSEPEEEDE